MRFSSITNNNIIAEMHNYCYVPFVYVRKYTTDREHFGFYPKLVWMPLKSVAYFANYLYRAIINYNLYTAHSIYDLLEIISEFIYRTTVCLKGYK